GDWGGRGKKFRHCFSLEEKMAVLHIGRDETPRETKKRTACGHKKWIVLFALATIIVFLLAAIVFLGSPKFEVHGDPTKWVIFGLFIAFVAVGLLATVLTSAVLILNSHLLAIAVFGVTVIDILLAVPIIVLSILDPKGEGVTTRIGIPLIVVFIVQLVFAAALAVIALLTFIEMRGRKRAIDTIRSEPTPLAYVATVNRSPLASSPIASSRSYESRSQFNVTTTTASARRYLS
ncbi:hypothetical protein PMAYCL1PPCAC_31330, partial [Pristionchus mayeri]